MSSKTADKKNSERGATLIELLVTLTIFAFVTIIITSSFLSILTSRNQVEVSQQLNDEFRLVIDTMEIEVTSGTEFITSDCVDGACRTIEFTVATRPDLNAYQVRYTHDPDAGVIYKTMERNDGLCDYWPAPASCRFPITSSNIHITFVNFDVYISGTGAQRPLVTVVIQGEGESDTGETVPLLHSTSYTPRIIQTVSEVEINTDNVLPSVLFQGIYPGAGSDPGCGVYSDADLTAGYDNGANFIEDQPSIPIVYTDCETVRIQFRGRDDGTGIVGGRYDGYVPVEGGVCLDNNACSETPRSAYSLPSGSTPSYLVYFQYDNIPLRPGLGQLDPRVVQNIHLRVKDGEGNINNNPETIVRIMQMSGEVPLSTEGMVGLARLRCVHAGQPAVSLIIAPDSDLNPYQKNVIWYRCDADDEFDMCEPNHPVDGFQGDRMELRSPWAGWWEWRRVDLPHDWLGRSNRYLFYNLWTDGTIRPTVEREVLYRYGFRVYDRYDPTRMSDLRMITWDQDFIPAIAPRNTAISDYHSSIADGRAFPSGDDTFGIIPSGFCPALAPVDPTDPTGPPVDPDPDPDPTDPTIPDPPPLTTIEPSWIGAWSATVVPGTTGYVVTNSPVLISKGGTATPVTVSYVSISPYYAGVTLEGSMFTLTEANPSQFYRLRVPSGMAVDAYDVTLEFTNPTAETRTLIIPLYTSISSGGLE